MKKRLSIAAALLLISVRLLAQNSSEALVFTGIERNPRAAGMAGAGGASFSNAAYSGFGKAAVIPLVKETLSIGAGLQLWKPSDELENSNNLHISGAYRKGSWGLSLAAAYDTSVPDQNDFAPSARMVGLGAAYALTPSLSAGVNLRYAAESMGEDATVSGFSADVSVAAKLPSGFSVIGGFSTLGTRVKGSQADADFLQPAYAFAGGAWRLETAGEHQVELALDASYYVSGAFAASFGAEYAYQNMVFVRAGYRLAQETVVVPSHIALGLGFQFEGVTIEAAWMGAASYAMNNNTLSLGLGYRF